MERVLLSLRALFLEPDELQVTRSPVSSLSCIWSSRASCGTFLQRLVLSLRLYGRSWAASTRMRSFGLLNGKRVPGLLQAPVGLGTVSSWELRSICWEASLFLMDRTHWPIWWEEEAFSSFRPFWAMLAISQECIHFRWSLGIQPQTLCLQDLKISPFSALLFPDSWNLSRNITGHRKSPPPSLNSRNVEFSRLVVGLVKETTSRKLLCEVGAHRLFAPARNELQGHPKSQTQ